MTLEICSVRIKLDIVASLRWSANKTHGRRANASEEGTASIVAIVPACFVACLHHGFAWPDCCCVSRRALHTVNIVSRHTLSAASKCCEVAPERTCRGPASAKLECCRVRPVIIESLMCRRSNNVMSAASTAEAPWRVSFPPVKVHLLLHMHA